MKFLLENMRRYLSGVILAIFLKLIGTISELTLPYMDKNLAERIKRWFRQESCPRFSCGAA